MDINAILRFLSNPSSEGGSATTIRSSQGSNAQPQLQLLLQQAQVQQPSLQPQEAQGSLQAGSEVDVNSLLRRYMASQQPYGLNEGSPAAAPPQNQPLPQQPAASLRPTFAPHEVQTMLNLLQGNNQPSSSANSSMLQQLVGTSVASSLPLPSQPLVGNQVSSQAATPAPALLNYTASGQAHFNSLPGNQALSQAPTPAQVQGNIVAPPVNQSPGQTAVPAIDVNAFLASMSQQQQGHRNNFQAAAPTQAVANAAASGFAHINQQQAQQASPPLHQTLEGLVGQLIANGSLDLATLAVILPQLESLLKQQQPLGQNQENRVSNPAPESIQPLSGATSNQVSNLSSVIPSAAASTQQQQQLHAHASVQQAQHPLGITPGGQVTFSSSVGAWLASATPRSQNSRRLTNYPMDEVTNPGSHDVLLGRGSGASNHIGNIRYRMLIEEFKPRYLAASRLDKPKIAHEIVSLWRGLDPPGRFLSRCENGQELEEDDEYTAGTWKDVGDARAKTKTCQCLREKDRPRGERPWK